MEFAEFRLRLQRHFNSMEQQHKILYLTNVNKDQMWDLYLNSFPKGFNNIYKTNREYDCNCCRHFIRAYGNIVAIDEDNNQLVSIWDIPDLKTPFLEVAREMSAYVRSAPIRDKFLTDTRQLGVVSSCQMNEDSSVITWDHLNLSLFQSRNQLIMRGKESIEYHQAPYRDTKNVFKRSMDELTIEAGKVILELIEQNSLYRGQEFKSSIQTFIKYKTDYDKLLEEQKDNWCWLKSIDNPIAKIRNTAIGTLLIDLSSDVDIETAVR